MKVSRANIERPAQWRVTWRSLGKTQRKYFKTRRAADGFAQSRLEEQKAYGEEWLSIPPRDRPGLVQTWKMAQERGYSVIEACRLWESHGEQTASGVTLGDLCTKFIAAKVDKGLRAESLRLLQSTIDKFKLGREAERAAAISSDQIRDWMAGREWGAHRRRGVLIDLANLFNWGIAQKLLVYNPVSAIERPMIDHKTPTVLTVEAAKGLLALCQSKYPTLLPWLAISLFAGLRTAEVERLQWENISDEHISLAAHQTKGRARRLVTVRPTLKLWLDVCRKKAGPVCPKGYRKLANALRTAAGGVPKNVLRHSFISYALGVGESVERVAMESGNSEEIIFRHYREVVTAKNAKAFWALAPAISRS